LFDLLKKKLGKFSEKVKQQLEKKEPAEEAREEKTVEKQAEPAVEEKPVEEPVEEETVEEKISEEAIEEAVEEPIIEETPAEEEKRALKPKVGIKGRLKAAITGSVELQESDLKDLLWELELALLEADVEQTTAEEICKEIKERLIEKKVGGGNVEEAVKKEIGEILLGMMKTERFDLLQKIKAKEEKPYKILFLGPNGAGKTTSIAKLTHLLQSKNLKVIWAAADTFRAASIEQLEKHAQKLKVRVIKHQYGADPAAVAFDAVKAAQSKRIDVVLVDTAGRQETNRNLMGELQKIERVIQPDLKIYVGEAFTGQALLQQAREYEKMVGVDGFILTKIDCDSKGGTTVSLLYKLGKPILFVGTGQEYKDLQGFEPEFVVSRVIG
jgi:fused signal recognition particle receptor